MSTADIERLRSIKTFPSLLKYLRDELDWPIELDDFDDLDPLTFDYTPEELGIDPKIAVKIKQIKRLRRLCPNQPWGVFFVNFVPKRLPVTVLRRILQQLVPRKRASASRPSQQTWQPNDLLFVSAYGEDEQRQITFAHFAENEQMGDLPILRVLGWDKDDTASHLADAHEALKDNLSWPDNEEAVDTWRKSWASAFILRHREVVDTSKKLAIELAGLATDIRQRVNQVLAVEDPDKGPMLKLMEGFKEALIHDLSEDDFADMYAQTIAYGLLAAAISRHVPGEELVLLAENIADMVPVTNPFLKELLGTFLTVGGRKKKLDFDELGISDIIDLLRNANLTAVLHDFGNQNPLEDPVIHFYELFLKEYDAKKRMKRGVFYTPKPVVSFIVRSVHEILKKDFGLKYGLADTATWGQMQEKKSDIKIPEGVDPNEPFVQILDPATGTGTFLVETIDVIYKEMTLKWEKEGHMPLEFPKLWNAYVPKHLLPRLYGFELLMAPYTIAHMKIGLKLKETGYRFQSKERARIYLTNTLEEPKDISGYFEKMAPALAHEAKEANEIKKINSVTIVIGNPPYAAASGNKIAWIEDKIRGMYYPSDEIKEANPKLLLDDYVKFLLYGQLTITKSNCGILGFITNNGYLDNPTFRNMRKNLISAFSQLYTIDLHGDSNKRKSGQDDENVFDIQQGVAMCIFVNRGQKANKVNVAEVIGTRDHKYSTLAKGHRKTMPFVELNPKPLFYLFTCVDDTCESEYEIATRITDIMPLNSVGIVTSRDSLTIDESSKELWKRICEFVEMPPEKARTEFKLGKDVRDWKVSLAQADLRLSGLDKSKIVKILYRPFDKRYTYYTGRSRGFLCMPRPEVTRNFVDRNNLGLITTRQVTSLNFCHVNVTRSPIEYKAGSHDRNTQLFPLYLYPGNNLLIKSAEWEHTGKNRVPNLSRKFVERLCMMTSLDFVVDGNGDLKSTFGPEDVFNYIYAVLYSPSYRQRYAEFLKRDFPRITVISNSDLFRALCNFGGELVVLHLMESDKLNNHITSFPVEGDNAVTKVGETKKKLKDIEDGKGKLYINSSQYFDNLPEEVWSFHIGGYQVCYKWLNDRKKAGRKLSAEDIEHYHKIVVSINETIKIMKQIDETIDTHGGWPIK